MSEGFASRRFLWYNVAQFRLKACVVYVREADELMKGARERVEQTLGKYLERNIVDWSSLKTGLRDSLSKYLYEKTKRRPMILPIIQEV